MAHELGTTPSGKVLEAYMQENKCMYRMRFTSGGEIPEMLQGDFTSVGECKLKADVWLALKSEEAKKPVRGKAKAGA